MSTRSTMRVTLPDDDVQKFYALYPNIALSVVLGELLSIFIRSAEKEHGEMEEVISRLEG